MNLVVVGSWRNMKKYSALEIQPLDSKSKCPIHRKMSFSSVWQWQKRSDFMTSASNGDVAYDLGDES